MGAGRSARIAVRRRLGNRLGRHDAAAVAGTGGQDPEMQGIRHVILLEQKMGPNY